MILTPSPGAVFKAFPFLILVSACGGGGLQLPTVQPQTLSLGLEAWNVESITDAEVIHDVTRGPNGVLVASSGGVYVFRAGSQEKALWGSTTGIAALAEGVFVARGGSIELLGGEAEQHPPIGEIYDLHAGDGGALWAVGSLGVARRSSSGEWARFGDAVPAHRIFAGAEGELWIATARGLWRVKDDVIEEHGERSLSGAHVRSLLSIAEGRAFALVHGSGATYLSYYDSERWTHYTLEDFDEVPVALGRVDGSIALFTPRHTLRIADASVSSGVPLVALERSERDSALHYNGAGGMPPRAEMPLLSLAAPARFARVPEQHVAPSAPAWTVTVTTTRTHATYDAWQVGDVAYVADTNRGVQALGVSPEGRFLRTNSLLSERHLRMASDAQRRTWILSDDHQLGVWNEDRFESVTVPDGFVAHALAVDDTHILIACTSASPNSLTVFRRTAENSWDQVLQRTVQLAPAVVETPEAAAEDVPAQDDSAETVEGSAEAQAVPAPGPTLSSFSHLALRGDEVWVGIRVSDAAGERQRGVAVFSLSSPGATYHHANAEGEGAYRMPDSFENIDLGDAGMAWFSTVLGAVRLGNSQAVTFGEARGVRGEVVGDVLVAPANKIWVAAAEGPGYYFRQRFEFRMPNAVRASRPTSLTLASNGDMWGAGPNGLLRYRDGEWDVFGEAQLGEGQAVTDTSFVAVEGDAAGRVWALGRSALWIITEAPVSTE